MYSHHSYSRGAPILEAIFPPREPHTESSWHGLASALCPSDWRESIFVAFSAYFDSSFQPTGGSFVVAGWLATGEQWGAFNLAWQSTLDRFGVPYMHMREFAHWRGPFENGWNDETKRRAFLNDLNRVIAAHRTSSFVCSILRADFETANKEFRLQEYFGNEYALCGLTCVQQVHRWLTERSLQAPAEYIFEDGDERGKLTALMESRGYPSPVYRPKKDRVTPIGTIRGLLPLQAADMLAYELRLNYDRYGEDDLSSFRKSFVKLAESADHQGFWAKFSQDDLRENARMLKIER